MIQSDPSAPRLPDWRLEAGPRCALPALDLDAFAAEVQALRRELVDSIERADLDHLRQMQRWGRISSALGYASAWIAPNPLSALLISTGITARWTMPAHHVLHRGYDRVPDTPPTLRSEHFARGWRRWLDWPDWILPAAWCHEHNQLHHFHTGELDDPDLVEHNAWLLRLKVVPSPLKWLLLGLLMLSWKWSYYAPNTYWAWRQAETRKADPSAPGMASAWRLLYPGERLLLPLSRRALQFWRDCLLPYVMFRFVLLPALFLPLGWPAASAVLINSLLAELLSNLHSFLIIVPNHAGEEVYRFDAPARGRNEFYLRQVLGTVNYPGGTPLRDFLCGHLNYQIEHHLFPDLPMRAYHRAAPRLKAICARHGVPYVEESVWRRFGKLCAILTGRQRMRRAAGRGDAANSAALSR